MIFHRFSLLVSFLVSFFLITNYAQAKKFPVGYPECWQDNKNPIILNIKSSDQFCPLNSKLGHKFFLVDFTSPLKQPQIDWISGRIFGTALIKETPPYHKVSFMKIDVQGYDLKVLKGAELFLKTNKEVNIASFPLIYLV